MERKSFAESAMVNDKIKIFKVKLTNQVAGSLIVVNLLTGDVNQLQNTLKHKIGTACVFTTVVVLPFRFKLGTFAFIDFDGGAIHNAKQN
jgi:hypothetical protein